LSPLICGVANKTAFVGQLLHGQVFCTQVTGLFNVLPTPYKA